MNGEPLLPPSVLMHQMLGGFQTSQALFVVAETGVATALLDGPREIVDLAAAVGADADALGRIIRFLAPLGVFRTRGSEVEITDLGRTLADGPPDSVRDVARYFMKTHYAPFGNLLHTARTGEVGATAYLGKPFFEWIDESPELAELQNSTMAGFTTNARGNLLDVYPLPDGATVADLGGADGTLLVEVLAKRPERRGIVFDLPGVVAGATATVEAAGLADRIDVVAGSFFERVPRADVYMMSAVLVDWDDAAVAQILRTVAEAAAPGA